MALDINKALKAALIPTVILIVIALLQFGISAIPILGFLGLCTGIPLLLVSWVVMAYAGYTGAKATQNDLLTGTVSGLAAGTIAGFVVSVVLFILTLLGVGVGVATGGTGVGSAALDTGMGILGIVWGTASGLIQGLIFGLIGAAIAVFVMKK